MQYHYQQKLTVFLALFLTAVRAESSESNMSVVALFITAGVDFLLVSFGFEHNFTAGALSLPSGSVFAAMTVRRWGGRKLSAVLVYVVEFCELHRMECKVFRRDSD